MAFLTSATMEWQTLRDSWKYFKECFATAKTVAVLAFSGLGALGTLRDNFFPTKDIAIINWIPPLPWYFWLIGTLVLLLTFSVESGFRIQKKLREQVIKARLQISYDSQSCLKVTDNKYLFSVVVSSILESVPGIIVALEAFTGLHNFGHLNRPFRFKHYPENGQLTCHLGEKVSVNVLFFEDGEPETAPYVRRLRLLFQGDEVPLKGEGPYIMTLRATGGGALPDPEPTGMPERFMEPATRIERATCGLRISANPTSDNLTPQETTKEDAPEVGTDGPELSRPGSSVVADKDEDL